MNGTTRKVWAPRLPVAASVLFASILLGVLGPGSACAQQDAVVEDLPPVEALELADAEAIALGSHPRIAEASARVSAARCHRLQVGLPPNPTAGYVAGEIGDDGRAGQQGLYVGQQFIRGNKLGLNRAVACQEIIRLEQEYAVEQTRVLTEVRTAFYEVYLAQREVELTSQLVGVSTQAADSVRDLLEAQEARRSDLLQAEIEAQRIAARLAQAGAVQRAAWRRLAAAMGHPEMQPQTVAGDPDALRWPHDWQESLDQLLARSPEVASAMAEVDRARATVRRECAEPIPDVDAQLSVQYDNSTDTTIAGVQVGAPIPLWNRNQGGIGRARHELTAARRNLEAVELRLSRSLAATLRQYETARASAEAYREGVLRRAEENLGLVKQAFAAGEASYLDLLTVQRTYFESNLDYLNALREVNQSVQLLNGLLLGDDPS